MSDPQRIQIRISDDELEAWACVSDGPATRPERLREHLDELGICAGLDDQAIEKVVLWLASEEARPAEVLIAKGIAALPASPSVVLLDEPGGPIPGLAREDGSLDFRERRLLVPIAAGERLGWIQPPSAGKPGSTIRGEVIEPEAAAELDFKRGDGIEIAEDGRLVATRDGARFVGSDGSIDVLEFHVHRGHVDPTSGNLETRGSLEIARDVTTDMSVRASRDIKICGVVDGGRVEAGGSIEILGGAMGRDHGVVRAGGDLRLRHALGIELYSRGILSVARGISTSKLHAREVEVAGKALSDSIQAETRISVQDVGSPAGGPCVLRVAIPVEPEGFDPSLRPAKLGGPSPRRGKAEARKDRKPRGTPTRQHNEPQVDLDMRLDWRRRQRALQQTAVIEIKGTGHAGCRLDFGTRPLVLTEDVKNRTYRLDPESGEIVEVENEK